jgi:hypothetical protein
MARRCHQALSAAVAGACLTLCACGGAAAPSAAGSGASATAGSAGSKFSTGSGTLNGHFCGDATSFLRHIPAAPTTRRTSATQARASLRTAVRATVKGFTVLETEAPASLHEPLKAIVAVYKSDEKALTASGNRTEISAAMIQGNASGSEAFQRVVKYLAVSCK